MLLLPLSFRKNLSLIENPSLSHNFSKSLMVHKCKFFVSYQLEGRLGVTGIFPEARSSLHFQKPRLGNVTIHCLERLSIFLRAMCGSLRHWIDLAIIATSKLEDSKSCIPSSISYSITDIHLMINSCIFEWSISTQ